MSVPTRWAVTSCVFDPLADEVLGTVDAVQVRVVPDAGALACSCGVPVPVRVRPACGQAAVKISFPRPCTGRIAAACPEIFNTLADAIPDPVLRQVLNPRVGLGQNTSRQPARSRCGRSDHRRRAGSRWVTQVQGFSRARRRA